MHDTRPNQERGRAHAVVASEKFLKLIAECLQDMPDLIDLVSRRDMDIVLTHQESNDTINPI